jgi:hypothetical protein
MGMAYGGMVIVGWVISRRSTGVTMSYVRLSAASVLLVWSALATLGTFTDARAQQDERGRLFLQKMTENGKSQQQEMQALDLKFKAINLSGVLAPQNLTDRKTIAESRAKIDAMKALIKTRGDTVKRMLSDSIQMIQTANISEVDRQAASKGMNEKAPATLHFYAELDRLQVAALDAIGDLLNFAEANIGKTVARNGQMVFGSQPAADEYNRLVARAQAAEEEETRLTPPR